MKRYFSKALIIALLAVTALCPVSAETAAIGPGLAPEHTNTEAAEDFPISSNERGGREPLSEEGQGASLYKEAYPEEIEVDIAPSDMQTQPAEIQLSETALNIGVGENLEGLDVIALPMGTSQPVVTWRSSNKKYVKIDPDTGRITGVRRGTAVIYAQTEDGLEAACTIRVKSGATGVSLSPRSVTLSAGMTLQLDPDVVGGASGRLTYKSSKPGVATVDKSGVVTAVSAGKATITVKTYNGKKAKCKVKVNNAVVALAFPSDTCTVSVGQEVALTAEAYDSEGNRAPADIVYAVDESSPDSGCIKLDPQTGALTAVRSGQAVVTATTQNNLIASCNVVVVSAPEGVRLSLGSVGIGVGEVFNGLVAEAIPPSGEEECVATFTWASSNTGIATVDENGVVTGVKSGTCKIGVKTHNGKIATCNLRVYTAPQKISITPAVGALKVGKIGQYRLSFSPSGSGGGVTYESSDSNIASVDSNGLVTAKAAGTVNITVTTYNGKSAMAQLVVSDGSGQPTGETLTSEQLKYVINLAKQQMGKPYIYGGGYTETTPRGFDCSGLMYWLFKHVDVTLKESAYKQGYDTRFPLVAREGLQPGDMVFFNTNEDDSDLSDHAALYIGSGNFIHASSSAGKVIISNMSTPGSYYYRTFVWGRRIVKS